MTVRCTVPGDCSEAERLAFAGLVRQGFPEAEHLEARVSAAKWLAFHYAPGDALTAVAALKAPAMRYRDDVFEKAGAPVGTTDYRIELGWVFVAPPHRGHRIGQRLCQVLLAKEPTTAVFATARPSSGAMITILGRLGFVRVGRPFPRRHDELVLFVRPGSPDGDDDG